MDYDEDDWRRVTEPPPLIALLDEDVALLHRHWLWANQQRDWFYELLQARSEPIDPDMYLADRDGGSMVVWYALLWSVIEGFQERRIDLRDPLGRDIEAIANPLKQCRNAVLHVPKTGEYHDPRILTLLGQPDAVRLLTLVHRSLGRMLLQEMRRRRR
jgi:hypothetical protein